MYVLDATTKSLEVILGEAQATALPVTAHYNDAGLAVGSSDTATNGAAAVTIVAAPSGSNKRWIQALSIFNLDNVAHAVIIRLNNNGTIRNMFRATLQVNESLQYSTTVGWEAYDANGNLKTGQYAAVQAFGMSSVDQSITSNVTLANLTSLAASIGVNETWAYDVVLNVGAGLATTGAKVAITVPAGATVDIFAQLVGAVAATAKTLVLQSVTGGATLDFTAANLASQTDGIILVFVRVVNGATAGSVAVQGAQSTSSATALLFRRGSRIAGRRAA